jgi:hypothetical protein
MRVAHASWDERRKHAERPLVGLGHSVLALAPYFGKALKAGPARVVTI